MPRVKSRKSFLEPQALCQRPFQIFNSLPRNRRDCMELKFAALGVRGKLFQLLRICHIDLRRADDHRLLIETVAKACQFLVDDLKVFDGIRPSRSVRDIDKMHQQARAFDVPQELDAESLAEMRALDETGKIRDYERLLVR